MLKNKTKDVVEAVSEITEVLEETFDFPVITETKKTQVSKDSFDDLNLKDLC